MPYPGELGQIVLPLRHILTPLGTNIIQLLGWNFTPVLMNMLAFMSPIPGMALKGLILIQLICLYVHQEVSTVATSEPRCWTM